MLHEAWSSLDPMTKILWIITIVASLIFIIQSIMTFLGADTGADMDTDTGGLDFSGDVSTDAAEMGNGMGILTFRNLVNFLLGFGWTAILLRGSIKSDFLLYLIAVLVGFALVAAIFFMFRFLGKMQQAGNINIWKQAVGCEGTAYLPIPAARQGVGKVQININQSVREYDAVTDGDAIPTGTPIRVTEVASSSTLVVEPLQSLII
jgi:magnesium-transporting ATPase (P-type)